MLVGILSTGGTVSTHVCGLVVETWSEETVTSMTEGEF